MKDFINKLYRNHALIYKLLLLIGTTFLIVYLFPKSGRFKYNFEKGKPWQSENYYAPFTFAIKKTDAEISSEQSQIKAQAVHYFDRDKSVRGKVFQAYKNAFKEVIPDSLPNSIYRSLDNNGEAILEAIYQYGLLSESHDFEAQRTVVILEDKVEVARTEYDNLVKQEDLQELIKQ